MTKTLDQYTSPTRKVIAMLHVGRDKLREKSAVVRENLRTAER